jgi:putative transposase
MVLVKPATVVRWHRQGFRPYWRWRSRPGRPSVDREVRDLIRQMNSANPLWGAPRIQAARFNRSRGGTVTKIRNLQL